MIPDEEKTKTNFEQLKADALGFAEDMQNVETEEEMAMADSAGCTTYTEVIKCARIEIVDPQYYGERIRPFDFEKTLVHELLHLKLCLIGDNVPDLQERIVHQLIDDLARAFVDAKNSKQTP